MPTLQQLAKKYEKDVVSIMRLGCAAMSVKVITRTPVKTGSARASWNPSINGAVPRNVYINSDHPYATRNEITSVANRIQLGDTFHLTNAIEYIMPLEYHGHSKQAPAGMMRRSMPEWQAIIDGLNQ